MGRTSTLQSLNLSHIGITKVTNQLDKLKNLTTIDLSFNRLSEVCKLNRRIKTLNLSHNRITSGKLSKIPLYIQHLNLSHNEITYLPLEFKKLRSLRTIELSGNPINCTCETLEVRNWLQENHVWTDNHVKCMAPFRFKGRPWLQIRQDDACGHRDLRPRVMPNRHHLTDYDNDVMLSDQPSLVDIGSLESINDEELGKDFLLVRQKKHANPYHEYEGSGDNDVFSRGPKSEDDEESGDDLKDSVGGITDQPFSSFQESKANVFDNEDENGSGSGGGLIIPSIPAIEETDDVEDEEFVTEAEPPRSDSPIEEPAVDPAQEPNYDLNIFAGRRHPDDGEHSTPSGGEEIVTKKVQTIQAAGVPKDDAEPLHPSSDSEEHNSKQVVPAKIGHESGDSTEEGSENKNTYILLAILLVLLVCLIGYVAVKRSNSGNRNNRRNDAENPKSTELQDMDQKKALGKPLPKNGNHEHKPLINDKKSDASIIGADKYPAKTNNFQSPEFKAQTEPLLQKDSSEPMTSFKPASDNAPGNSSPNTPSRSEANNNNIPSNGHVESPVPAPRTPAQNSEGPIPVHQPLQNGQSPTAPPAENESGYTPVSPRPARYSPVYSPETGRVKIKLTETAKPKTPLLVTRSRSNAGDIITTPNLNQRPSNQS